jgi:hypothetical protein
MFTNGNHLPQGSAGHSACLSEPFPTFCSHVTN